MCLDELLSVDLAGLRGKNLKAHEDRLDALCCAYLAYYFWFWGPDRNEIFGDAETGYIANPRLEESFGMSNRRRPVRC